jgi:hypothetical protein
MRVLKRSFLLWILLILITSATGGTGFAQSPDAAFIPETGHWIRGEFYKFYQSVNDPLLAFGYPITDQIVDPTNGETTQYFQRVRLDLLDGPSGLTVQIAPLGELLYTKGAELVGASLNSPTCKYFPTTGKTVCYAFMQFYDAHNGAELFGNPISEMEYQDGGIVQYFERARFEWRAERPVGQRVVLSDLGRIYFDARVGNSTLLEPAQGNNAINILGKIHAHAFISNSLASVNSQQVLSVIAQDEYSKPIRGAMVSVTFNLPDNRQSSYRLQPTDTNGVSKFEFTLGQLPTQEIVSINVDVQYQDQKAHTATWFQVWW